mgnify:CR=1 FL=1
MTQHSEQILAQPAEEATRQFLTFTIGEEHFGMELHQTREIIEYAGITQVPLMPQFLCGVINCAFLSRNCFET